MKKIFKIFRILLIISIGFPLLIAALASIVLFEYLLIVIPAGVIIYVFNKEVFKFVEDSFNLNN